MIEAAKCYRCGERNALTKGLCGKCASMPGRQPKRLRPELVPVIAPSESGPRRILITDGREFEVVWDGGWLLHEP